MRLGIDARTVLVVFAIAATSFSAHADDFQGTWQVWDSKGKPFQISLEPGGAAIGTQHGGMRGNWKREGSAAVVFWNSGWTTKIDKKEDHYIHTAWGPHADGGAPSDTSVAEKLK